MAHINALLRAAGLGSTQSDRIVRIDECRDYFEIHTEWSTRGCAMTSEYRLPYALVDAADGHAAAVTWARTRALEKAQAAIDSAKNHLLYAEEAYAKAQALPA